MLKYTYRVLGVGLRLPLALSKVGASRQLNPRRHVTRPGSRTRQRAGGSTEISFFFCLLSHNTLLQGGVTRY